MSGVYTEETVMAINHITEDLMLDTGIHQIEKKDIEHVIELVKQMATEDAETILEILGIAA